MRWIRRAGRARGVVAVVLALVLSVPLDGPVHELVWRHLDSHEFRLVANGFSALGTFWAAGGMLAALAVVGQRSGDAALVRTSLGGLAGIAVGGVAGYVVKQLTCRARPRVMRSREMAPAGIGLASFFSEWPCLTRSRYQSFPSGHANTAFALASALIAAAPGRRRRWLGVAAGVAASRLLVNAHFLSDVLAGGLLGWTAGQAGQLVVRRVRPGDRSVAGTVPRGAGP